MGFLIDTNLWIAIENALFLRDNCRMLFGDAKASLQELVTLVKEG